MNKSFQERVARKRVLLNQSALYRLMIRQEIHTLGENLQWAKGWVSAGSKMPVRSILFGFLLQHLGHGHFARLLVLAGRLILLARISRTAVGVLRRFRTTPALEHTPK